MSNTKMQRIVDEWNDAHAIGTRVRYWTGLREGTTPTGTSHTRTEATLLGGHTPVVWVDGEGPCIALTHVDALNGGAS